MDSDSQGVKFIMRKCKVKCVSASLCCLHTLLCILCLDVIFRKDSSRAKKDKSQLNMNVLRKSALALSNQAKYGHLSKRKEDDVQSSP